MADYIYLGAVLAVMLYLLWSQRVRSDVTAVLVMLSLIVPWPHPDGSWTAVLSYQDGFSGFGSSAVVMIAAMFVIAAAIVQTGAAEVIGLRGLRAVAHTEWKLQAAVLGLAVTISTFINDTTVVLILLPLVITVCKEFDLSPSRYLLFVAYGSLLGGQWTLIGTRSNIIVSDFLRQQTGEGIPFFDFAYLGAPIFVASAIFLLTIGRRFLPDQGSAANPLTATEYLTEVLVQVNSSFIGSTTDAIELLGPNGLSVVAVVRDGEKIATNALLEAGDAIVVRATPDEIRAAVKSPGLRFREQENLDAAFLERADLIMAEVIMPARSGFAGYSPRDLGLQRQYGLTILGISHFGHPVKNGFMDTRLRVGDSILVLGTNEDVQNLADNTTLIPLRSQAFPAIGKRKAWIVGSLLLAVVSASIFNILTPAISIPLAAAAAVMLGCLDLRAAYDAIHWPTIVTLGAIISFGRALEKTGAAHELAEIIVAVFSDHGTVVIIGGILLIAVLLTQIIENAAVAIVVAPIAYEIAVATSLDPANIMVALAVVVSAGFSTPIAHESTLLVMGPGNYEFRHYLTLGSVLAVLTWVIATLLTASFANS